MKLPGNYAIQEFGTLAGLVKLQAAVRPDHVAITDLQASISYGRFDRLVDRIAAALHRDGVVKGCCHDLRPEFHRIRGRLHWIASGRCSYLAAGVVVDSGAAWSSGQRHPSRFVVKFCTSTRNHS